MVSAHCRSLQHHRMWTWDMHVFEMKLFIGIYKLESQKMCCPLDVTDDADDHLQSTNQLRQSQPNFAQIRIE